MPPVGASAAPTAFSSSRLVSSRTYLTSARRLEVGVDHFFVIVAALACLLVTGILRLRGGLGGRLHERLKLLREIAALLLELVLAWLAIQCLLCSSDGVLDRLLLVVGRAFRVVQSLLCLEPEAVELVLGLGQLADLLVLVSVLLGLLDH